MTAGSSPDTEGTTLNPLGRVVATLGQYGQNASNNVNSAFSNMTTENWIRLTVIVGGYLLLRPYLMQFATKGGVQKLEEQEAKEKAEERAQMTANEFRGVKEKLEEHDDEDDDDEPSTGNWGQQARVRQRKILRQLMEAEEQRRLQEEDDKDIQEFLVD
ncbi:trafficking PGA2-domain-containing protein [Stachybotrys elegans]|uniref:Trafficking PGA2-domain-containing protein n=1 Tax=Stachybotrys elegans TaxID=80388 RepID=A0A8K0SQB0_9HYPO|nr:trafficking PGA2-domain-containing protein [Stachybotrys elegans]